MEAFYMKCNLCNCRKFSTLESDKDLFKVLKCTNCSLIFVHPHPLSSQLKDHYNEFYYTSWMKEQRKKRHKMWEKRLNKLQKFRPTGKILDVGCGDGLFLEIAKNKGWQISGTELSQFASEYASKALKKRIFNGELKEAKFSDNSFDVVTMWHVLEHVSDPKSYLREIHRILKPEGLLLLAVPNINNLVMRFVYRVIKGHKIKLYSQNQKEFHLYHFSKKTLKKYFDSNGFCCANFSPDYGIIEFPKRMVNWISVIPYYALGIKIFNSIEAVAIASKDVS